MEPDAMDEMISLTGLTKRFGPVTAVDDISLSIKRGEVLGFLGPNGAGKSTTMRMVTGFVDHAGHKRRLAHSILAGDDEQMLRV